MTTLEVGQSWLAHGVVRSILAMRPPTPRNAGEIDFIDDNEPTTGLQVSSIDAFLQWIAINQAVLSPPGVLAQSVAKAQRS